MGGDVTESHVTSGDETLMSQAEARHSFHKKGRHTQVTSKENRYFISHFGINTKSANAITSCNIQTSRVK